MNLHLEPWTGSAFKLQGSSVASPPTPEGPDPPVLSVCRLVCLSACLFFCCSSRGPPPNEGGRPPTVRRSSWASTLASHSRSPPPAPVRGPRGRRYHPPGFFYLFLTQVQERGVPGQALLLFQHLRAPPLKKAPLPHPPHPGNFVPSQRADGSPPSWNFLGLSRTRTPRGFGIYILRQKTLKQGLQMV